MMTTQFRCNRKTASWLCALLALAFAVPAIANIDGAIFTTTATGTTVNGNIYPSKADVYLSGGPQNQNSNGLPPGNYYFQVTDPSGAVNLSTDDDISCRQVLVNASGVISAVVPTAPVDCSHAIGTINQANGSTPVQLIPY